MIIFSHLLHSPFLGLLPLAVVAWYGWKLARTPAPVSEAAGPLAALLGLGQLPVLLVLRLALPSPTAGTLGVLLLVGSVYAQHRLLLVLVRTPAPTRWPAVLLGLAVLNAGGLLVLLPTSRLAGGLPTWAGYLALAMGVLALIGLLARAHRVAGPPPRVPRASTVASVGPLPIAAARRAYYRQAKGMIPGLVEYLSWFHTLPAAQRPAVRLAGITGAWKERPFRKSFRRYVLEHRGYRYVNFMAEHLDAA